jgi:hypothetical protein
MIGISSSSHKQNVVELCWPLAAPLPMPGRAQPAVAISAVIKVPDVPTIQFAILLYQI